MKKIFLLKNFNCFKKIKFCLKCHNILGNKDFYPNLLIKNLKLKYIKLKNFKLFIKYNFNMNFLIINIKNSYIMEILKYFLFIPKFKKKLLI